MKQELLVLAHSQAGVWERKNALSPLRGLYSFIIFTGGLAGRLEAAASNPHSSPNTRDNRVYSFKPYNFLVVSDPLELL
ncbi:MAG: hypothetical protein HW390_1978, partial [Candidatus Brocadiaceae bacterium]|nr:hypothetical protein [Candidatus Brocadiaceae bacterium]